MFLTIYLLFFIVKIKENKFFSTVFLLFKKNPKFKWNPFRRFYFGCTMFICKFHPASVEWPLWKSQPNQSILGWFSYFCRISIFVKVAFREKVAEAALKFIAAPGLIFLTRLVAAVTGCGIVSNTGLVINLGWSEFTVSTGKKFGISKNLKFYLFSRTWSSFNLE